MANNAVVNRQVNVYINSGEAAKAYDKLIAKEKILNAELVKTTDPKRMKVLQQEIDKLREPIERAAKKVKGELAPSIRELELATRKFLNEFKKTGDPETLRKFQAFKAELDKAKVQLNGMSEANAKLTKGGIFSAAFWANLASNGIMKVTSLLGDFFGGAIQEALDADAATRRLQSTLDNLGRGDVFDRISRKADEMADKFRYLDNDDVVAVFNKLIDYGKLTEAEMNNLLPVIIDFAAKSRISLEESTSVIIKALEGNAKALKEYGINIKDAGDETDRLNIIMTTLKDKVDGAGEAFQNSAAGGIATARQEFANLKEEIGNGLLPVLNKFLSFTSKMITGLGYLKDKIVDVGEDFVAYFKGGIGGVTANRAAREVERRNRTEAGGAQLAADTNTAAQIQAIIDAQYKRSATLVSLFSRGELTEETFKREKARVDELIRVYGMALDIRTKAEDSENNILGTGSTGGADGSSSKKVSAEKKVDLLRIAYERLWEIQKKALTAVQAWGAEQDKKLNQMMKAVSLDANAVDTDALDQRVNNRRLAGLEFNVLTTRGKARLNAELELLNEQERQELKSKQWTEDEKLLIEEKYRQRRKEAESSFVMGLLQNFKDYAAQVFSIVSIFDQVATQRENAELARDRAVNERKQRNLESRLRKGLISQQQYERELNKIELAKEKKEKEFALKQFKRQKAVNIATAAFDAVMGVLQVVKTVPKVIPGTIIPNPQFPPALAFAIASGAAAVGAAIAQKPPQYAAGGKLGGRSHADGGNAVIDGSGRKIAEVEAGEGIVNKRTMADRRQYSVSGTPSQIISRLNGMYGTSWEGGAVLNPAWKSYSPQPMNFSAMRRVYAAGGPFTSGNGANEAADNSVNENMLMVLSNLQGTLASIQQYGIMADVSLTRLEEQEARLAAIRRDATMS